MTSRALSIVFSTLAGAALLSQAGAASQTPAPQDDAPKILFTQSPRAVEYQLGRLTNDQLVRVERNESDPKYRPVYYALLTRKGIGREYFDEALGALTKLGKTSATAVLLEGLSRIKPDDEETAGRLLRVLFAQPAAALRAETRLIGQAAETIPTSPFLLRGAYGALMLANGSPDGPWSAAVKTEGHLVELLRAVPYLPAAATDLRGALYELVAGLLGRTKDAPTRAAALAALGHTRADAAVFRVLAKEAVQPGDADMRAAAIRSLHALPNTAWPAGEVEPLARALVALVKDTPQDKRTEPAIVDAMQLGEKLADALGEDARRSVRRDLRALGVQVVRIEAVPEGMVFDRKWFAVEAGKPVQIVLYNPDAMSHNLVLSKPGSMKEVGIAASSMTLSTDPKVKPYVPDSPLVLQATRLINWGETDRLSFTAPSEPGEYPYLCTFPGHWVRMYGVMLVVPSLDAWEAKPTVPKDPMTGEPYRE